MISNYLKIATRNLIKHKGFSFINVFGLAVGMTVCLLMLMYVVSETSFENFHKKKDKIYRVSVEWGMKFAGSLPAVAPALRESVPEVETAARLQYDYEPVIINSQNERIREEELCFADQEIFDILTFEIVKGDRPNLLSEPNNIVLTEQTAEQYFGKEDPIGETINYNDNLLKVSGVIKNFPANSHLSFRFLVSYSTLESLGRVVERPWNQWGDDLTYFLLKENASVSSVHQKLDEILAQNAPAWIVKKLSFVIDNISDIHWNTELRGDVGEKGNIIYIYVFLSASIFILLIACFNFINLSISKYIERMKEIGVRKVIGAKRGQLVFQYLIESLLLAIVSIGVAFLLFQILHLEFYTFLDTEIIFSSTNILFLTFIIIGMVILVGLMAGSYPALYLSKFKPVDIVKNGFSKSRGRMTIRKALVVFQFSISIILILVTILIHQQIDYMKNTDLGFDKSDVLLVNFPIKMENGEHTYNLIRDEILKNPAVINISGAYTLPGINSQFTKSIQVVGTSDEEKQTMQCLPADYGYIKSLGLSILEGRDFSKEYSTDANEAIILNQSAVKALNLNNPIGTRVNIPAGEATVVGVVKDFHVKSLHNKITPMFIQLQPDSFIWMAIKIQPDNSENTVVSLKDTWAGILPNRDFNFRYLEDVYNRYYRTEEKTNQLLSIFTSLAIFVSCLGLLGLVYFMTTNRIKEIGIRKVLGASVTNITTMLSKQFAVWVFVANIIAWPAAYYLINLWLQNFAYKVDIGISAFLFAGGFTLIIALITVGFQTIKAALANPIKSIRYE